MEDSVVWETIDRLGRVVRMTRSAWRHVVERHAGLAGQENDIRDAVAQADAVVLDRGFANREIHRREGRDGRPAVVVVIHYRPTPVGWIGFVVTAFNRSRPEKGLQRWP